MNSQRSSSVGFPDLWNLALLAYLILCFATTALFGFVNARALNKWIIGDWLINYEGGFVRRGLPGSLVLALGRLSKFPPEYFVLLIQLCSYAAIFVLMYLMVRGLRKKYWLILLCFSPATFAFQVYDKQGGFRKEILVIAFFAAIAFMLRKNVARLPIALTAALFTTVAALSHEVAIFYTPYYLWLFQARDKDWRRSLGMFSFVAVPAVIVTAAAYLRPGDADVIAAICKSLGGSAPSDCNSADMAAISFLSRSSIVHEMGVTLRLTARLRYSETYSLVVVLLSVPWLLYLRREQPLPGRAIAVAGVLTAISTLLVFLTARDWGRFLYLHNMLLFILVVFRETERAGRQPEPHTEEASRSDLATAASRLVGTIFFALYCFAWHVPHFGDLPVLRGVTVPIQRIGRILGGSGDVAPDTEETRSPADAQRQ